MRPPETGRPRVSRRGAALWAVALTIVGLFGMACRSADQRATTHVERADALLEEGRGKEALLELQSAVQLTPTDIQLNLRLAEVSLEYGYLADALDFYREAHHLAPDDNAITLTLARLLVPRNQEAARKLLDGVLEQDASDVEAHLVKSALALESGDTAEAMRLVQAARRLEPENPDVFLSLAKLHEARIAQIRKRTRRPVLQAHLYEAALDAYDEYRRKGGDRWIAAMVAKGDVYSMWPGHTREATKTYLRALQRSRKIGSRAEKIEAAQRLARHAETIGDRTNSIKALAQLVGLTPEDLTAWQKLAANLDHRPGGSDKVFRNMLDKQPQNPEAHIIFAEHIARTEGLMAAIRHLRDQATAGLEEPVMLAGIAYLQLTHMHLAAAAATTAELSERFPDHPATGLAVARRLLAEGDYWTAAETLQRLIRTHDSQEARHLLATAEHRLGRNEDALATINMAISLDTNSAGPSLRLKARILFDGGKYKAATDALQRLQRRDGLRPKDRLLLARTYYETGLDPVGRKILFQMIDDGVRVNSAAMELTRRDADNRLIRGQLIERLEEAYAANPRNTDLLRALTELDIAEGRSKVAMKRLHRAVGRRPRSARLYLLRGQTEYRIGLMKNALDDAERAVILSKRVNDDAYELLARIYSHSENPANLLEAMQQADAEGRLSPDRRVLLARLHYRLGNPAAALAAYERALLEGSKLTMLKNDLAYLLAEQGTDLGRAEQLARAAADAPGENLAAVDTLGYVYLRLGRADAALWQFRFVTENADPPVAEYYYHLGLALVELERPLPARSAFEKALSIDPEFPSASEARRQLGRLSAAATAPRQNAS